MWFLFGVVAVVALAAVAAGGVRVLVVGTERAANVAAHRRLDGAMVVRRP